jgi:acyl-coenzyme A synthetase/AMP-(fatty) acid ligase
MHIVDMIFYWARTVPHRRAIIQSEMVTSFHGLAAAIDSISERIDRLNLDKREPVAICIANPTFMLATLFAVLNCGYSAAPVTQGLYPHLAGAGLRNLIYDEKGQVASGGRNIRFDMSWLPNPNEPTRHIKRHGEHPSVILFTSGTTGLPKKVIEPASGIDFRLRYSTDATELYEKVLVLPALTSSFGFNRVCEILNRGKTLCIAPDGMTALSLIALFKIDVLLASTAQALSLAEISAANPGFRVDTLKAVFIGGGKIGAQGLSRIQTTLCRNIIHNLGSTEGGTVGRTPLDSVQGENDHVPMPWVEVEIVDESDRTLAPGAEGIVRLRTPQLVEAIIHAGQEQIPGVKDGWFYPGDLGSLDDNGVFSLVGRSSEVINRGGVKVSAIRIAEMLKDFPEIDDAAACAVPGPSNMDEIWIAVVAKTPIDVQKIKQAVKDEPEVRVAPDQVFLVDQIPRNALGKVQQVQLRELLLLQNDKLASKRSRSTAGDCDKDI